MLKNFIMDITKNNQNYEAVHIKNDSILLHRFVIKFDMISKLVKNFDTYEIKKHTS
jgi:hypothetical protein